MVCALVACSSNPPQEEGYLPGSASDDSAGWAQTPIRPVQKQRPVSGITMTYHNDASTLQMTIDPYDENLNIEMKRSPHTQEVAVPEKPRRDTVFMMSPQAASAPTNVSVQAPPTSVNVQLQLPPERRDSSKAVPAIDTAGLGQKQLDLLKSKEKEWADATDEVITNIRLAQEYFYKQDYSSALRLVKIAEEKRPTAEGYALRGSIMYMLRDNGAARFYWSQALTLNPNLPDVIQALSKLDQTKEGR
jgi:tetratricopeptide (TPR) repeat protein